MIVEGAVEVYPYVGAMVVIASAINGIAILRAYRLFTGTEYQITFSIQARWPEKVAILIISVLVLGGGVYPQPGVRSRYHAAKEIMARRETSSGDASDLTDVTGSKSGDESESGGQKWVTRF